MQGAADQPQRVGELGASKHGQRHHEAVINHLQQKKRNVCSLANAIRCMQQQGNPTVQSLGMLRCVEVRNV